MAADDHSASDDPLTDEEWAAFKEGAGIDQPPEPTYRQVGWMSFDGRLWWADDYTPRAGDVPVYVKEHV